MWCWGTAIVCPGRKGEAGKERIDYVATVGRDVCLDVYVGNARGDRRRGNDE